MSGIKLLPENGEESIDVPDASTVIGRGPFLKVVDKRVSRSHALLEVIDGKLHLTPTHTNPCFLRCGGKGTQQVLKRDLRQPLEEGDMFGLLPDQLFYTVTYDDASINGVKRNGESKDPIKKEAGQRSPVKKKEKTSRLVRKEELEEEEEPEKQGKIRITDIIRADGKNMALPLMKKRKLPVWMIRLSNTDAPAVKKKTAPVKAAAPPKRSAPNKPGPRKRKARDDFLDDEDERPARKSRKPLSDEDYEEEPEEEPRRRAKGKQQRRRGSDDEDEDFGARQRRGQNSSRRQQDDSDELPARRPKRAATQKRGSYVEDYLLVDEFDEDDGPADKGDSDSDFRVEGNDDGDSGSDWDKRRGSPKKQAKKPAGRTPARGGRKRKARRGSDSEGDDFEESNDEYIPRPTKRRGGASQRGRKAADSEEDEEDMKVQKKAKKSPSKSPRKKAKEPCYYGSKCYRRNPDHFNQFSHPGDSEQEEEEMGNDNEKKAAVKGRKRDDNKKSKPEATKAKKKTKSDEEEDDDGLPNTYDYNDSFIDDGMSQSLSQTQRTEEDSEEDMEDLKASAKFFLKNKKMMKPV